MELKVGDIVMFKFGGQLFIVVSVKGDDVFCVWMGVEGDLFCEMLFIVVFE